MSVADATTTASLTQREIARLRDLLEKQAIYENMVKYTRALDRNHVEMVKDAYWPDATDDHGMSTGSAHAFADAVDDMRNNNVVSLVSHLIGNTQIELEGTRAKAEFAFMSVAIYVDPDGTGEDRDVINVGRYRDLYEKRGDEWKILRRTVIWEWNRDEARAENWSRVFPPECTNFGADY